ncbi:MAG: amidohydrolase family protein [Thermoleophilaceae bacterium]
MQIDVHQHLWPAAFLAALRARRTPPRLDGWELHLPGQPPYRVDPAHHDPDGRAAQAVVDGDDLVCVSTSAALGLDRLPSGEAEQLADAWLEGALALPAPFRPLAMPTSPDALEHALARGAVGLELGADLLAAPGGLERLAPLLAVLDEAGLPLLVHPGPAGAEGGLGRPAWWAPVVPYVAQLHAAWWAWADGGRERFPSLPLCFVALAGLGPLHGERQRARGGGAGQVDPLTFVEISTYGTQAVDAVLRVLGIDVVCHGSDRPYADPVLPELGSDAALHAIRSANPGRLLARVSEEVTA